MTQDNQPIVVNLPEGQNTLTLLQGSAPRQLDQLAPYKTNIRGIIDAPLEYLKKRIVDIDQHKAHIFVNRDDLSILLVINEDDSYTRGEVFRKLQLSKIFEKFGINTTKQWEPEDLGQFFKLNRTYFVSREENMKVVNARKQSILFPSGCGQQHPRIIQTLSASGQRTNTRRNRSRDLCQHRRKQSEHQPSVARCK